jgi:ComF family protein
MAKNPRMEGDCLACPKCLKRKPRFDRHISVMRYGEVARSIILPLKHGDKTQPAKFIARLMLARGRDLVDTCDIIMPVPIHFRRLLKRKYNQAGLIANFIGKWSKKPVSHCNLKRVKATDSQGHKNAKERARNVRGAFKALKPSLVKGKKILLVDDVFTTGATLSECARELKRAGAAKVYCLTMAKA